MRRTAALIIVLALSIYGASASPPGAPPIVEPAKDSPTPTDEALTKAVNSALSADPNYYYRHVEVRVDKGVAKLSGYVDSSAAISRARKVAGKVPGITRVVTNHLQIDTQLRR
ncbi:MAG: BON domain-containing protein [Steroidobacteraceae bacterium]